MDDLLENTAVTDQVQVTTPKKKGGQNPWVYRFVLGLLLTLTGGLIAAIGAGVIMSQHTGPQQGTALLKQLLKNRITRTEVQEVITGGVQASVLIQPFTDVDFTIRTSELKKGDQYDIFLGEFARYLYENDSNKITIKIKYQKIQKVLNDLQGLMEWYQHTRNAYFFFGTIGLGVILLFLLFFTWRMIPRKKQPYVLGLTGLLGFSPLFLWIHYPKLLWSMVVPERWFSASEVRKIFIDGIVALGTDPLIFEMVTVLSILLILLAIGGWIARLFDHNKPGLIRGGFFWIFILGIIGHYIYLGIAQDNHIRKTTIVNHKQSVEKTPNKIKIKPLLTVMGRGVVIPKLEIHYYHLIEPGMGLVTKVDTFTTDDTGSLTKKLPDLNEGLLCGAQGGHNQGEDDLYGCVTTIKGKPIVDVLVLNADRTVMGQWPSPKFQKSSFIHKMISESYLLATEKGFMVRDISQGVEQESGGEIAAEMMLDRFWGSDDGKKLILLVKKEVIKQVDIAAKKQYPAIKSGYQWNKCTVITVLIDQIKVSVRETLYQGIKQYLSEKITQNKLSVDATLGTQWRQFLLQQIDLEGVVTEVIEKEQKKIEIKSKDLFHRIDEISNKYPEVTLKQVIDSILEQKAIITVLPKQVDPVITPKIKTTIYSDGLTKCSWSENGAGNKDGLEKCYYQNRQLKSEINFKDGLLHGRSVYYGKDGTELDKRYFEMGKSIESPEVKPVTPITPIQIDKEDLIHPGELLEGQ